MSMFSGLGEFRNSRMSKFRTRRGAGVSLSHRFRRAKPIRQCIVPIQPRRWQASMSCVLSAHARSTRRIGTRCKPRTWHAREPWSTTALGIGDSPQVPLRSCGMSWKKRRLWLPPAAPTAPQHDNGRAEALSADATSRRPNATLPGRTPAVAAASSYHAAGDAGPLVAARGYVEVGREHRRGSLMSSGRLGIDLVAISAGPPEDANLEHLSRQTSLSLEVSLPLSLATLILCFPLRHTTAAPGVGTLRRSVVPTQAGKKTSS